VPPEKLMQSNFEGALERPPPGTLEIAPKDGPVDAARDASRDARVDALTATEVAEDWRDVADATNVATTDATTGSREAGLLRALESTRSASLAVIDVTSDDQRDVSDAPASEQMLEAFENASNDAPSSGASRDFNSDYESYQEGTPEVDRDVSADALEEEIKDESSGRPTGVKVLQAPDKDDRDTTRETLSMDGTSDTYIGEREEGSTDTSRHVPDANV
jgi:hypothetical protein